MYIADLAYVNAHNLKSICQTLSLASFRLEKELIFVAGQMMGAARFGGKRITHPLYKNAIFMKPCDFVHCFTQSQHNS